MNRNDEIKKASIDYCIKEYDVNLPEKGFNAGAAWADSHPIEPGLEIIDLIHDRSVAYDKLKIATEALEDIAKIDVTGTITQDWLREWRNDTKIKTQEALAKIKGDR